MMEIVRRGEAPPERITMELHTLAHIIPEEATLINDDRFPGGWSRSQTYGEYDTRYEVLLTRTTGKKEHDMVEQIIVLRSGIRERTYIACKCGKIHTGKAYDTALNQMLKHIKN